MMLRRSTTLRHPARRQPVAGGGSGQRRGGFWSVVGALAVLVALIGSAQAGTSTKFYRVGIAPPTVAAGTTSAAFTLTLTNDSSSTQTLGSANFTSPWSVTSPLSGSPLHVLSDEGKNWTVSNASNVVQFRANSSGDALNPGHSVSASVNATVPCNASGTVTWTTRAKQSNSFNGPPGNDFVRLGAEPTVTVTQGNGSLGGFVFDTIGSQTVNVPFTVTVTAKDICGFTKADYGGGALLSGNLGGTPTYGSFGTWSQGSASASVTATASQTGATLTATDGTAVGTSNPFDVFDAICTSGTLCEASNSTTDVQTRVDSATAAIMGLMLSTPGAEFTCNGGTHSAVGSLVTLSPSQYGGNYFATLRYDKSVAPGTGVANFIVCLGKNGTFTELAPCKKSANPPCISSRNRNGVGDLVIVLLLDPTDPVGGTHN